MSLSYLNKVFAAIERPESISIQLLRITNSKDKTHYHARQINVRPEEELSEFIHTICSKYTKGLSSAEPVDDYTGDVVKGVIYKLSVKDELIASNYQALAVAVVNQDTEGEINKCKWNALLIKEVIMLDDEKREIWLVSMKSPVSVLKNRFIRDAKDEFIQVKEPVLTLSQTLDAVVVNDTLYMLTMQAENLFVMERSYNKRCSKKVDEVAALEILSDVDSFKAVATKGQNPRRFVSFNQSRLEVLRSKNKRKRYMKMFGITLDGDGAIDTRDEKASERLVKFLCDKAMLDPIDDEPREVSAAKAWS